MIVQLRREVASMREALQSRQGDRPQGDRERPRVPDGQRREVDQPDRPRYSATGELPAGWQRTKEGRVFTAYDRNGDLTVTLDEWFAMQEGLGEGESDRKRLAAARFKQADPNSDGKMTAAEFLYWYTKGRFQQAREGGATESREREGDRPRETPDREEPRREEPRRETRDGDREAASPRDREE